jgi:thiopeptide-type bacteriocin biosynthesis protein
MIEAPDWISLHVPLADSGDGYLLRVVAPLVDELDACGMIDAHFFIRYLEGGPHLRVRLHPTAGQASNTRDLALAVLSRHQGSGDRASEGPYEHAYVPEVARYGGREAVAVAEDVFRASSVIAYGCLRRVALEGEPSRRRLALRLLVAALGVHCHGAAEAQAFVGWYSHFALLAARATTIAPALRERASRTFAGQAHMLRALHRTALSTEQCADDARLPPDALVSSWAATLRKARDALSALADRGALQVAPEWLPPADELGSRNDRQLLAVLASQIHMMNNRLGVDVLTEAALAELSSCALRRLPFSEDDAHGAIAD